MSRGLKKLIDTCNRTIKAKAIGFIYHIDENMEKKLIEELNKKGSIIYNCRTKGTKAEFFWHFENALNLERGYRHDVRMENIKEKFSEGEYYLVFHNADALYEKDYDLIEEFNQGGAAIILMSSSPKFYSKIQDTSTYRHKPVIEHDFAEIN